MQCVLATMQLFTTSLPLHTVCARGGAESAMRLGGDKLDQFLLGLADHSRGHRLGWAARATSMPATKGTTAAPPYTPNIH